MSAPCRIGGLGETIAGIVHAVVVASGASSLTSAWIRWVSSDFAEDWSTFVWRQRVPLSTAFSCLLRIMFRVLTPASPPPFIVYRFGCELLLL